MFLCIVCPVLVAQIKIARVHRASASMPNLVQTTMHDHARPWVMHLPLHQVVNAMKGMDCRKWLERA